MHKPEEVLDIQSERYLLLASCTHHRSESLVCQQLSLHQLLLNVLLLDPVVGRNFSVFENLIT